MKMRYHRSLRSKSTPAIVKEKILEAKTNKKLASELWEQWCQAGEDWGSSQLVMSASMERTAKKKGTYKLMSRDDP